METLTIDVLIFYTALIFVGFFIACLELAFQYFMMPNMILYPWAVLLSRISRKNEIFRHLMRPFGRCRYCNCTWISVYCYFILFGYNIQILFLVGISFFFLKILSATSAFVNINAIKVDEVEGVKYAIDTPWQAMMKSYVILGLFEIIICAIPIIFHLF
jgi:hypothetical protein